jgi:hypothetical protein
MTDIEAQQGAPTPDSEAPHGERLGQHSVHFRAVARVELSLVYSKKTPERQEAFRRGIGTVLSSQTEPGTIWSCATPDQRRTWAEKHSFKSRHVSALMDEEFAPAELLIKSRREIKECLKQRKLPVGGNGRFDTELRKNGHAFYRLVADELSGHNTPNGDSLASFEFVNVLGKGSYGDAFEIRRRQEPQTRVAIKVHALSELTRNEFGLRFKTDIGDAMGELNLMARIKSDSVLITRMFGKGDGLFWTIADICEGGDLELRNKPQTIKERGVVSETDCWRWMVQCVGGLDHMHEALVCHFGAILVESFIFGCIFTTRLLPLDY